MRWLFIDDSKEDRDSFARALSDGERISVHAISAAEARRLLASGTMAAAGLLMDIDLSNESSSKESGLGLTADIRAAQHRGAVPSFPVVRFSYRAKVAENIGRDASSDQYFDLRLDKDGISEPGAVDAVRRRLAGVASVYAAADANQSAPTAFSLNADRWDLWGSPAFEEDLRVADRAYARARLVVQALEEPGLLISEELLATRLGVSRQSAGWSGLQAAMADFRYGGTAADDFPRWWARGLESWWEELSDDPLAVAPIAGRFDALSARFSDLTPLDMPAGSPGDRPWRNCALTMEETGEFLPLDPSRGVRFRLRAINPDWLDPTYAALGPAVRHAEDPRLDQADLNRLRAVVRGN